MFVFPGCLHSSVEWVAPFHMEITDLFFTDSLWAGVWKPKYLGRFSAVCRLLQVTRSSCAWRWQWHRLTLSMGRTWKENTDTRVMGRSRRSAGTPCFLWHHFVQGEKKGFGKLCSNLAGRLCKKCLKEWKRKKDEKAWKPDDYLSCLRRNIALYL